MRILVHEVKDKFGTVIASLAVHTERAAWNQVEYPKGSGIKVELIDFIRQLSTGAIPIAGTGWDVIVSHPLYANQSMLNVFKSELVRLNDAAARGVIGV